MPAPDPFAVHAARQDFYSIEKTLPVVTCPNGNCVTDHYINIDINSGSISFIYSVYDKNNTAVPPILIGTAIYLYDQTGTFVSATQTLP